MNSSERLSLNTTRETSDSKTFVSECKKYCLYSQSKEKMKKADFTASLNLLYNNIMNIFYFFLYGYKFQLSFMRLVILFL